MVVRKTVVNSFSWAMMGLALTGAAYGQVAVPEIADGSNVRDGQIRSDTVTEAPAPAVNAAASAAASADVDVKNNVGNTISGTQKSDVQAGSNANHVNPFGATFDSNTTDRLIIRDLQANSVASRLGLQAGDRIIGLNGQTYTDATQFDRDLAQLNGNTDMPIIYERNGMRYTKSFRMSLQDAQQSHIGPTYSNSGSNNQSYNSEQVSHRDARPDYGTSSNSGYAGGMAPNQGYVGGNATYGNNFHPGQAVCCGSVHAQQFGNGHHHGGRRHRRCCR